MATRTFADRLRQERRALGLTQAELAERAQLSERAISDMERGLKTPQRSTLHLLADALGLSAEQRADLEAARDARRQQSLSSSAQAAHHNLPTARTSFVGREHVLANVRRLIGSTSTGSRLLTLTGPGGTGKTRVALEAAASMLDEYADGVCFVALAPIGDPRLVAYSVAQALGVSGQGRHSPLNSVKSYLRERHLLLILDNFEQVLGAAVDIAELLAACPRVHALVTSRAPLRLLGEQELAVPPLGVPETLTDSTTAFEACESVRLFVERASAVKTDFLLSDDNAAAVAEICRRLDGLPLAIELAAARIRLLEPRAMLGPLERRLQLLTGGARDAPARQQTLRNTIAWSYDLLEPDEQALFRHLAVFVGGCSLVAAQHVSQSEQLLDLVESLSAKSLVRPVGTSSGEVRVGMFETIREFGLEQLGWTGELESLRRRHAEFFLELAQRAEPGLGGPAAPEWLDRLERDHDNLRAAMDWALAHADSRAARLAGALARFWWIGGHFNEGSRWLQRALALTSLDPRSRLKVLYGAAWLAHVQRDSGAARRLFQEALAIADELDDDWARAWVLHGLGRVAYFDYDPGGARAFGEQSLQIAQALGDRWLIGWALHLLGLAAYIAGEDDAAHAYYGQTLAIRREIGHLEGLVIVLHLKGMVHHRAGDLDAALALYREALDCAHQLNSAWFFRSVLPLFAAIAAEQQPELAARLGGAVTIMSESAHTLPIPITEAHFNAGVEMARRKLGDTAFDAAWAEGRAMSLESAIAEARTVEIDPAAAYPAHLTPAEVEVLRRLAAGCTTRQIAEELVVAISTVDRHITHIYQKIGRRGRAAAAAFALEHGLA